MTRTTTQNARNDYLRENPTKIEYKTQIDVAKDEGGRHVLEVARDGNQIREVARNPYENPVQTEAPLLAIPDLGAGTFEIEGPDFDLGASSGRFNLPAFVVTSDLGIGVASLRDFGRIKSLEDIRNFGTVAEKEKLKLGLDEIPLEDVPYLDHGGKSVCIEFDVLSGDGQVQVVLKDDDGNDVTHYFDITEEVSVGGIRGARATTTKLVDKIEAVMTEGMTFEDVQIKTTGDLEIVVTGIDLNAGYEYEVM